MNLAHACGMETSESPCKHHDTLAALGWFDGCPMFTARLSDKQCTLLQTASEKYGCEGAELLERLCVVAMTDMSGEEMHTVKESDDGRAD
jgi:hypothetical protein